MSRSKIFLWLLLTFISGIFLRSFFEISQNLYFFAVIFFLIMIFVFYQNKKIITLSFIVLFFILGIWRMDSALQKANDKIFENKIVQENAIVQKISESSFGKNLIIELETTKINLLLQVSNYPEYAYGDELKISCTLKSIENRPSEGNEDVEFDYRMYMAKEGVLYQCADKKFSKIGENKGNMVYAGILKVKNIFSEKVHQKIAQPEGALAGGILFGGNDGLSKELQEAFSKTGMTHIVAVSGYNVTIIAEYLIMLGISLGLWRAQATWFAIFGIIIFVTMVGLPASAVRAGVMASILLWAMKHGRISSAENAIIFAAAIMLYLNPLLLRYDVGFQLSFLATLGIVLTGELWEKSFVKKHNALGISETIAMSLSAQIFVLPIIAYNFHAASLVSLLANVLILPIIPLSMLLVFLVSIFGFIFMPLSYLFSWLAYLLLHFELWVIQILANFPWASIEVDNFNVWWIFVYYSILFILISLIKRKLIPKPEF